MSALRITAAGLALAALSLAAACSSGSPAGTAARPARPAHGTTLDRALPDPVAGLPMTDQNGRTVTLRSLRGKTVVLTAFLTTCQEICPMISVNMRDVSLATQKAGLGSAVQVVEVTVDPERDTPARMAAYQKLFGGQPNWALLTAAPKDIAALWKSLGVAYARMPMTERPLPKDWQTGQPVTYDVSHQDVVFVIDKRGHERWLITGSPQVGEHQPPATLLKFLSDEGHQNLAGPAGATWSVADVTQAATWVAARG